MSAFTEALAARAHDEAGRSWLYVPYDQLSAEIGPLSRRPESELGVVLIESSHKARRRPYHKQKLALVLANMRHFALELAERGVAVRYICTTRPYAAALRECIDELGPLEVMEPAERELRAELASVVDAGGLRVLPHEGWLSDPEDFTSSQPAGKPWRMDRFYRHMRKRTGLLMRDGKPEGGKLSHDADNRRPWRGDPVPPEPLRFTPDAITLEVCELVEKAFADHPGRLDPEALPATAADAQRVWEWAKRDCMPHFGPFEDAMTTRSRGLFHTRISPLLNLHRLLPRAVVDDVAALDVPIASREGFVRQVLGWREFVRHVHRETDGLRVLPSGAQPVAETSDGGAKPNFLDASRDLPPAFWGAPSGMRCLDEVVSDVWDSAYGHHITRLMIASNLAALLDVEPRQVADWFWVAYADAYDWVVEPNVLGMGLFAVGELMTTKPYVCGTPYINRMSDFCASCRFDPKRDCPISRMYWAYLSRHEQRLAPLNRMRMPLASLARRSAADREADRETFERVSETLREGHELLPPSDEAATGSS